MSKYTVSGKHSEFLISSVPASERLSQPLSGASWVSSRRGSSPPYSWIRIHSQRRVALWQNDMCVHGDPSGAFDLLSFKNMLAGK